MTHHTNEKAVGVLPTPATAQENTHQEFTPNQKRLATLKARAALAGVTLYEIDDDRGIPVYIVSRWALTRQLDSLDAAERWLDQVAGVNHG